MKKLEGGFINEVYLENGIVKKVFGSDILVGISAAERARREAQALSLFGGTVAPRLLSYKKGSITVCEEFIEGELYETKARRGENVFKTAGELLQKIHNRFHHSDKVIQEIVCSDYWWRFRDAMNNAGEILQFEQLLPTFSISQDIIRELNARHIHGDFWLGNIIGKDKEEPKAIDWEFSDIGSPYEDFAIADLWIFREFPNSENDFWKGYGVVPDKETIDAFLILRCVEFLATTTLKNYLVEEKDGFYHNKVSVLRTLCV